MMGTLCHKKVSQFVFHAIDFIHLVLFSVFLYEFVADFVLIHCFSNFINTSPSPAVVGKSMPTFQNYTTKWILIRKKHNSFRSPLEIRYFPSNVRP